MQIEQFKDEAVGVAGDIAGAVVAPETGLAKLRDVVTAPVVVATAGALVAAFWLGRRSRRTR
ncbi:hypothetical protein Daura_22185 [Dactylosporangium aurantiacum]|uniref:Uncharacterized protein n=1 Tax=Dactylosporangium aurantiacum TaxID=35754 RepID=A0A9Q9IM22_9ACTN|nr:hypothetical protein [Dactylosporangium aurantiacum]MDG6110525.1 hypothetical protein [Dactylosporangium aurantiacum]UWZ58637.1 hypothetical protein Daura_22185 [Dactylosporangium aurantiacum]